MTEEEISGRAIAQHCIAELEKIALSPELIARAVKARAARTAATQATLGASTGPRRWAQGSAEQAAYSAAKAKNVKTRDTANHLLLRKRKDALALMGSKNPEQVRQGESSLRELTNIRAPTTAAQTRSYGNESTLTPAALPAPPMSMGRKAAYGVGAAGLAVGGAYAGNAYLNRQKGYGQY